MKDRQVNDTTAEVVYADGKAEPHKAKWQAPSLNTVDFGQTAIFPGTGPDGGVSASA